MNMHSLLIFLSISFELFLVLFDNPLFEVRIVLVISVKTTT